MAATATLDSHPPPADLRAEVREALTATPHFARLPDEDRKAIANSLVRIAHAASLLADEASPPPGKPVTARAMNAGDEFGGTAVDRVAGATRAILGAISFPRFVNELITGVFKAMLEANQQQLQQYLDLIRGVSQSLDGFTTIAGSDASAMNWLAEQFPASFEIERPDPDDAEFADPDDPPEPPRLRPIGPMPSEPAMRAAFGLGPDDDLPSGGAAAMIPFARRQLAKNKQQMLASMVSMGMQRIVIDSGRISAGMRFHIDARSAAKEDRSSQFDTRTEIGASGSVGFGFWSASASLKQNIGYVSTNAVSTTEELNASADLNSSVELHFRTDQVPLDRLASEQTVDRLRLNTLNPEKELELANQADGARATARATVDAARAAQPRAGAAPSSSITVPQAPPLDPAATAGRTPANQPAANQPPAQPQQPVQPPPAQPQQPVQPPPVQPQQPVQPPPAQPQQPVQPPPAQPQQPVQPPPVQPQQPVQPPPAQQPAPANAPPSGGALPPPPPSGGRRA